MRKLKKLFVVVFVAMLATVLSLVSNVKASASSLEQNTPYTLVIGDSNYNEQRIPIIENMAGFDIAASYFYLEFKDSNPEVSNGNYWIWLDNFSVEPEYAAVENGYVRNGGRTASYSYGGNIRIVVYYSENGVQKNVSFKLKMHLPLEKRISTNYIPGKYYYTEGVTFRDESTRRDSFGELEVYWINHNTGESDNFFGSYLYSIPTDLGRYDVLIKDHYRNEYLSYSYEIVEVEPQIVLEEYFYGYDPKVIASGSVVSGGVKVSYLNDPRASTFTYYYTDPSGVMSSGSFTNGFTFYRKGQYIVSITNVYGIRTSASFTISSFGVNIDPEGVTTVGTEVTLNGGDYNSNIMTEGYTRCVYMKDDAPSASRLDYHFTSSNNNIASVSAYGTITAKSPGTVTITCTYKGDSSKFTTFDIVVLPDFEGGINEMVLTTDLRDSKQVGSEVSYGLGAPGGSVIHVGHTRLMSFVSGNPSDLISDYYWVSSDESIATVSEFGTVEGLKRGVVTITCYNKYNQSFIGVFGIIIV